MKNLITIISAVLLTANVFAQAPQSMSYQAVIRNAGNTLVTGSSVGMRISILQGSISGSAVYVETQTTTTNANGLATIAVGNGTVVSGNFSAIDWTAGPYFIKTETDPDGGTNYTIAGTSQLMSVPYALYAATSGSSLSAQPGPQGPIGAFGGDSHSYFFQNNNLTSPPAGHISFDDDNTPINYVYISKMNGNGTDITAWINAMAASTNTVKGRIRVFQANDASNFVILNIYAVDSSSANDYQLSISYVTGNVITYPIPHFTNNQSIIVTFSASGNAGLLQSGASAGNTPYWDGSQWVTNNSNIYNSGSNVGINTSTPAAQLDVNGNATIEGNINATGFAVPNGTSAQFLKADGSLDTNTYLTTAVTNIMPVDTNPNPNGAMLNGTNMSLEPASTVYAGVVTTGAQSFAGPKHFYDSLTTEGTLTVGNGFSGDGRVNIIENNGGFTDPIGTQLKVSSYVKIYQGAGNDTLPLYSSADIDASALGYGNPVTFTDATALHLSAPWGYGIINSWALATDGSVKVNGNINTSGTATIGAVTYPNADGGAGQVLTTNGNGAPTWQNAAAIAYGVTDGTNLYSAYGIDSVSHTSTGNYTITCHNNLPGNATVSCNWWDINGFGFISYYQSGGNTILVRTRNSAGADVDADFSIIVFGN